jgi:hypothetical protein
VEQLYLQRKKENDNDKLLAVLCARPQATGGATMKVTESKNLKKSTRVYWRGDAADSGIITETSWDAVTIAWDNGKVASIHHGDMGEIQLASTKSNKISALKPSSTESS